MKKIIYVLTALLFTSHIVLAITDEDKSAIRARIDEAYQYEYYNPEVAARKSAKKWVDDNYFFAYIKCKNNCEIEWNKIRAKANNFSIFTNAEAIQKEAKETFYACMENNCEDIKRIQIQECHDYIDEYIEVKNKNRKK